MRLYWARLLISGSLPAAIRGARSRKVVREHGHHQRRRVKSAVRMRVVMTFGDGGGIGEGAIAGTRSLALNFKLDFGFECLDAEILPALLDLDVG